MERLFSRGAGRMAALAPLVLLLAGVFSGARAQVARYVFSQSSRPYVPITGGTVLATALATAPPGPPGLSGTVHPLAAAAGTAIPFPFVFNGTAYTGGAVASGGYLTLGPVLPFARLTYVPGTSRVYDIDRPLSAPEGTDYEAAIAVLAGDIWGNTTLANGPLGQIRCQALGAAPNRVFVVQWANMKAFGSFAGLLNYQVRLYETSNVVELAYGPCATRPVLNTQVGLRGYTPNDFTNRTGTWAAPTAGTANTDALPIGPTSAPVSGTVFTYTPPAPLPCGQPFSLTAAPAGTQARLAWRSLPPSPGPYAVVWGAAGFNPATGGLGSQTVAGTTATITGLTPGTAYEFYVTQLCGGAAGTSPPSAPPGRFRTTALLNDEAADAIALPTTVTCQPVAGTTVGASPSAGNGYDPLMTCTGTGYMQLPNDVWYTVTTATTGPASTALQLTAFNPDPIRNPGAYTMQVYGTAAGAAGPFTRIACTAQGNSGTQLPTLVVTPVLPGTTYYVRVANQSYLGVTRGPFTICSTVPDACGAPMAVSPVSVLSSTATTAYVQFRPGSGATGYNVTLTPVVPPGGAPLTLALPLSGSPVNLTGLQPATTYAGTFQAICAGNNVSAAVSFSVRTRPVNDSVANATALPLTATCQPTVGSTENATATTNYTSTTGCGPQSFDVWYTFTTPATGPGSRGARILGAGAGAQLVRVFTAPGPTGPFTQVFCGTVAGTSTNLLLDIAPLTPSTTYYMLVGGDGRSPIVRGPFTICVTEPPTCGTPQGVAISSVTPTGANLTFIAGSPAPAGTTYTVTLVPQGGGAALTVNNSGSTGAIPLAGLTPGTFYTAALVANCGAGGPSQPTAVDFFTTGTPANDLCTNAQVLNCGDGPLTGTVTGATAAGDPTAACAGVPPLGPGVWYRLAGTGQTATVSTCYRGAGNIPDMQLLVYSGSCGALTCVASNDDAFGCSNQPTTPGLAFATTAGVDYYLLLADTGFTPATAHGGQFEISATCAAPAACPAPTGLTVTATGPTAATATWTPVPGVTFYQVVWEALGRPAATALDSNAQPGRSSVTNTQLLPNQAYLVTVSSACNLPTLRSVGTTVAFSTVLSARNPALAALVQLYPNPARTTATLEVPAALRGPGGATATLYNALGQAVRRLPVPPGAAPVLLDVAGLPTGRYLLRLDTPGGGIGKALVVE